MAAKWRVFRRLRFCPLSQTLQCVRDKHRQIVEPCRRVDEHAAYRGAVRNSRGHDEATVWDRLFALWFRRLCTPRYGRIRKLTLQRCNLPLGSTIVHQSHPGMQRAVLFSQRSRPQVYAIDLNEAHLSHAQASARGPSRFLEIRRFLEVFCEGASPSNSSSITGGCVRCLMPMRAPTGTSAT